MFLKNLLFAILIISSLLFGSLIATFGIAYPMLLNPKSDWIKMFTEIPVSNQWIFALSMIVCGMATIVYPAMLWMNWKQNIADNKKRDKALRMHDRMVEALKKCRDEFMAQSDEGKYPKRFLQQNGGEGYHFITKLIQENEKE